MKFFVVILAMLMVLPILTIPFAFVVMLLLGVAHSFNPLIPPFGFMETWMLTIIFSLITGRTGGSQAKS